MRSRREFVRSLAAMSVGAIPVVAGPVVAGPLLASCGGVGSVALISRGPRDHRELVVAGARIDLGIGTRGSPVSTAAIEAWVRRAAVMVVDACGRLPLPRFGLDVVTGTIGAISGGVHLPGRGVVVFVGRDTDERALERDPILVHELMHTAFPRLLRRHRWMREGLSTYLETTLRGRAGILTEEEVLSRWVRGMPNGLPAAGDRGLDRTHTWGRVYWGGALLWLLADVELRVQTGRGLPTLLRGIVERGGDARVRWSMERLLDEAEAVSGSGAFGELVRAHARRATPVDLEALWDRLGVVREGDGVRLSADAELSEVRGAMIADSGLSLPAVPRDR